MQPELAGTANAELAGTANAELAGIGNAEPTGTANAVKARTAVVLVLGHILRFLSKVTPFTAVSTCSLVMDGRTTESTRYP